MTRRDLAAHVAHFQWRVLQDALQEATAAYWERRAAAFEWARPTLDDWHGEDPVEGSARAKYDELTAIARACQAKADFLRRYGLDAEAQDLIAEALADQRTGAA